MLNIFSNIHAIVYYVLLTTGLTELLRASFSYTPPSPQHARSIFSIIRLSDIVMSYTFESLQSQDCQPMSAIRWNKCLVKMDQIYPSVLGQNSPPQPPPPRYGGPVA